MADLKDLLVAAYNEPDPNPFLYEVGQEVRLRTKLSQDGQTDAMWEGAICMVLSRMSTGLHKEHFYQLQLLRPGKMNKWTGYGYGWRDDFREEEIDRRSIKKHNRPIQVDLEL